VATQLLSNDAISQEVRDEALYNRAKSLLAEQKYGLASVDFTPLSKDVRIVTGAEAKYWVAYCYYQLGALENAEEEIMSFAGMKTQHQYWLAKAFILLSDIHVQKGDLFQAKQYLLSLQNNYRNAVDDIHSIIAQHLEEIDKMMTTSEENQSVENDSINESQETFVEKEVTYE
jgi:ATP/maltotriose-dependent transcriptional regulator MalT